LEVERRYVDIPDIQAVNQNASGSRIGEIMAFLFIYLRAAMRPTQQPEASEKTLELTLPAVLQGA
jgi:hypothetical protein